MNGAFEISRNVRVTASGLVRYLGETVINFVMAILLMIGLALFNFFRGVYFLILGAIVFYFVGGSIAWILCWIFYKLGCAYLGHSV